MADTTAKKRRAEKGHAPGPPASPLLPVCDTVSGYSASQDAAEAVRHYDRLAEQLWLPPLVRDVADGILEHIRSGRTRWASISGPYGYGKTAAGVTVWRHARTQGFTAIPPLSCSNFDEFAQGVAAVAAALHPQGRAAIERLFRKVWERGLDEAVQGDARRYQLPVRSVRKLLQDKLQAGQLSLDGQCHRLVEFLSELGRLTTRWSHGLIVVMDEVQQLLGPLDTRAVIQFREFVWGMRTEQSPCGVVVCLDAMLEARLARWAADLLHRIRESGPTLQLTDVYSREFPTWLWGKLTTANGVPARAQGGSLTEDVLLSLGQFVERPDLANGPRTVVDVFCRAIVHFGQTRTSYGVTDLVTDLHGGVFRYFGEGAPVQRILAELLADEWVTADADRTSLVRTLAAFPRGCPPRITSGALGSSRRLNKARTDMFGPLLVDLPEGLALERLQQVRRLVADWEHVLSRCWDTLPSQDSLLAHSPDMIWRVLGARLFPDSPGSESHWERTSNDSVTALTGWRFLRGSFDDAFPQRDLSVWVGAGGPSEWPQDVDIAIALVCDPALDGQPMSSVSVAGTVPQITVRLPMLRPLPFVPAEVEKYRKYLQPEPFRALTILAAVHELESIAGRSADTEHADGAPVGPASFVSIAVDFLIREVMQGEVNLGPRQRVRQRGIELIRALFSAACRTKIPDYRTLATHHHWATFIETYRSALKSQALTDPQRQGQAAVEGAKAPLMRSLLGQKSTAAGDSLLRVLGPLVEASGSAEAFSIRFPLHPGESIALEYLRNTGRKRAVPRSAVQEALRHRGYLTAEADAILGLLADRGLVAEVAGGVRPIVAEQSEGERAKLEIATVSARLRALQGEAPPVPGEGSLRELWAHLDHLRQRLVEVVAERVASVDRQGKRLRQLIGAVKADSLPETWTASVVATHLGGIGKLLGRAKVALLRALEREATRLSAELHKADSEAEEWAVTWRKRSASFEADWGDVESRVTQFQEQAESLRAWTSLNERIASLKSLSAKLSESDPAIQRLFDSLAGELREGLATGNWAPVHGHADVGNRLTVLETNTQRLLFSRIKAHLGELDSLRVRYGDFLSGLAPLVGMGMGVEAAGEPSFSAMYEWTLKNFTVAAQRLKTRRGAGSPWTHPTRKSQSWSDIDGQLTRALSSAKESPTYATVTKLGDLLLLARQGFIVAASADGDEVVYEGADSAHYLSELSGLIAEGKVRVRVEWIEPGAGK